ncbi:MAG: histidine phosphatase family protein [Defluviitaleaceae bacterium]|nr:histidine phosphatase family protein [Defluviitaleaceae bacterium]
MDIYLVRHGQTLWNKIQRWQGHSDTELDEVGIAQAANLAKRLSNCGITAVHASPLKRARKTADAICGALDLEPFFHDDLMEISFGHWEGLKLDEIRQRYPEQLRLWEADPYADPGNGIENYSQLYERAIGALRRICLGHKDNETIAIVTHGAWIRAIILHILNIPLDKRLGFSLDNAGITLLHYNMKKDRFTLETLNEHWFLGHEF